LAVRENNRISLAEENGNAVFVRGIETAVSLPSLET
jgi:hypothetical protein